MTNETAGNRFGTADRHLIGVIGDQVLFKAKEEDCFLYFYLFFYSLKGHCHWYAIGRNRKR